MGIIKWILIAIAGIVLVGFVASAVGLYILGRNQPKTEEIPLGAANGKLTPCPQTPNCVSTQADPSDESHYAEPIPYDGSAKALLEEVAEWIGQTPRAHVLERRGRYLRAVFESRVFGFRDDVELFIPEDGGLVHFRSASRVGKSDLGVNRSRYREFRDFVESYTDE